MPVVIVLVGAWIYRWVDEDAFIDFRVIDNLLAGHGLVFNLGERVEVDSDPLWLFTLTALHEALPFVALEWLSVVLGLVCTGSASSPGAGPSSASAPRATRTAVFPLGLLMASVVAGVWEFATSGLEMSMVFLWLGAAYLVLVRVEARRRGRCRPAVVLGLGTLIRPELALVSVVLLVGAAGPGGRPGLDGSRGPVAGGTACRWPPRWPCRSPTSSSAWRYYALLVPNTGLAKAGGVGLVRPGLHLPVELRGPVHPVAAAAPGRCPWSAGGRSGGGGPGDRTGVLLLATPLAAGLVDLAYVVAHRGRLHARPAAAPRPSSPCACRCS